MTSDSANTTDHAANIRSADQRATALAATATITASLALTGASIVVDTAKMSQPTWVRPWFSWILVFTVLAFTVAAAVAVNGHRKQWDPNVGPELGQASMSKSKHNHVTGSMSCLLAGMVGVLLIAFVSVFARGA
jgi:hypothetical protein